MHSQKFYRLNKNRELTSKPIETQRFWYHMTHKVDAVFEDNDFAYFFSGFKIFKYQKKNFDNFLITYYSINCKYLNPFHNNF